MQHQLLYFNCMVHETNLYRIRFEICSFLRKMQMHKVPSPGYNYKNSKSAKKSEFEISGMSMLVELQI